MSSGSRLKLRASVRSFGRAGSLSVAREGRMCIGRLKCGAVLTSLVFVRCGSSRNWPRVYVVPNRHCAPARYVPVDRREEERSLGNNRGPLPKPRSGSFVPLGNVFSDKPTAVHSQASFLRWWKPRFLTRRKRGGRHLVTPPPLARS